jgi:small subunit ribosomal protein S18
MGYRGSRREDSNDPAGGNRFRRKRVCNFCVDKIEIDYKKNDVLRRYVNEYGRIKPRRQTGTCAKHQRELAVAIKRARHIALLPFVSD